MTGIFFPHSEKPCGWIAKTSHHGHAENWCLPAVKGFKQRVKGTEKFWNDPTGAEAVLTVRASLLSEDDRFAEHSATRPGCRYVRRSTLETELAAMQESAA